MSEVGKVELVFRAALGCGEGPHWMADQKALVFVDIPDHTIYRFNALTGHVTRGIYSHGDTVTFVVPLAYDRKRFLMGSDLRIAVADWNGEDSDSVLATDLVMVDEPDGNRFNDGKCDSTGRLIAGTMGSEREPGKVDRHTANLYTLDNDKTARNIWPKISLSNGMAWSSDEKIMYYVDTLDKCVDAFDYDISDGTLSNRRVVFDLPSNGIRSLPDGMTIDVNGNLWLATYFGGSVLHIDPTAGKLLNTVKIPAQNVTSCAWGGENLDELYVTTASRGADMKAHPLGGSLFRVTELGVKGRLDHSASIPLK